MLASVGVSYRRTPLATLDKVTLRDTPAFYKILKSIHGIKGAVVLQTCNRVEMFLDTQDRAQAIAKIQRSWALENKFKLHELQQITEQRTGEEVLEYLVRLASGLESMMLGENQIVGQLRSSLTEAREIAASSPTLSRIFEMSLAAGTKIRDHTRIGHGTVSLGSAALKLAEDSIGPLDHTRVLLLGTGEIGMMMMKALKARGVSNVTVASRTQQRAEMFSRTFGGKSSSIKDALAQLGNFDLVIVATKAPSYLLTRASVQGQLREGRDRIMILDLSIPRNVSADIDQLERVTVKTMEDLRDITSRTENARKTLAKEAEPQVREAVEKIRILLRREEAEPMVTELYHRAEEIRKEELDRTLSKLNFSQDQKELLEKMSLSMVRKLLAQPVFNLREAAKKGDARMLTVAGHIFEGE